MVAVAVDEGAAGRGTQRRPLVLAFLVRHERLVEDAAIELALDDRDDPERALAGPDQVGVDHDDVIDVPLALIGKRAVAGLEHRQERREEIVGAHVADPLLAVHILDHAVVGRVVVHITHRDDLDVGILLHQGHRLLIHNLRAAGAKVAALAADTRREVRHEEGEHLAAQQAAHHQDVARAEIRLLLLIHIELDAAARKGERDRTALQHLEHAGPVEQRHVHATTVGTVEMDDLEVGLRNLGLDHQVLEDVAVLDLAHAQHGVPDLVVLLHCPDDRGHVVELLGVFDIRPLVFAVGQIFIVVLALVVIGVEEVLEVVEADHVVAAAALRLCGHGQRRPQDEGGQHTV